MLGLLSLIALGAPTNNGHHDLSPAPNEAHHSSASALALLNGKLMLNSGSPAPPHVQHLYEEAVAESNETYVAEMLDGTVHAEGLRDELNRMRSARDNARNERNDARNERNDARNERDSFRDRFNNAQNEVNNFRNELNNKRNELAVSVSEVGNLRGSLSTVRANFQNIRDAIQDLGACASSLPGAQPPLELLRNLGASYKAGGIQGVGDSVRDTMVTPIMQNTKGMVDGLREGMEMIRDRIDNVTEDGEFDVSKLKGLPRELTNVIKDAASSFPLMKCVFDMLDQTPAHVMAQGMNVSSFTMNSHGEVSAMGLLGDSFMMQMVSDMQADLSSQFEKMTGMSVGDVISPPPPPMTPPSAPSPPPTSIREGWCSGFTSYRHINAHRERSLTMDSCFAKCTNDAQCNQAVFETADSKWGAQCWLGGNVMNQAPDGSRAQCTDYCFSKASWTGLPPSPPPSPPPHPPVTAVDASKVRSGWCPNFQGLRNSHFTTHAHSNLDESWCFNRCDNNPRCNQAVFESADSKWGAQCWLGSHGMSKPPLSSRRCPAPGCFDTCYNKAGWSAAEATVAAEGWSTSGAMPFGGNAIDRILQKKLANMAPENAEALAEWSRTVADVVGSVCNKAEEILLDNVEQITQTSAESGLAEAFAKPKYDPVLCPLVRGQGGVSVVEAASALSDRLWTTFVDWGVQRIQGTVIDPAVEKMSAFITNIFQQFLMLTEGLFGLIPEVGAIIFNVVTAWMPIVATALVNKLSRMLSRGLTGGFRTLMLSLGDTVNGVVTARLTELDNDVRSSDAVTAVTEADIVVKTQELIDSTQSNAWYVGLVKPMMYLVVKPFIARVYQNMMPEAHSAIATCRVKVVKVKNLVQAWVCNGDYAPHRTFPGTRVTYTNSGGGFAAMTGGMGLLRAMHNSGALGRVSYLGGNSGGQWLLSQLLYSKSFFEGITSNVVPIEQVIREYGAKYTTAMEQFPAADGGVDMRKVSVLSQALLPGFYNVVNTTYHDTKELYEKVKTILEDDQALYAAISSTHAAISSTRTVQLLQDNLVAIWTEVKGIFNEVIASWTAFVKDLPESAFSFGKSVLEAVVTGLTKAKDLMLRLSKALVNWWLQRKYASDQASHDLARSGQIWPDHQGPDRDATGLTGNKMVNYFIQHSRTICTFGGANTISTIVALITKWLALPAVDWQRWLVATLTEPFPEVATAKYSNQKRNGLSGAVTFIQQVSMPPDQYQNTSSPTGRVTLDVTFSDATLNQKWKDTPTMALPIAHYSTGCSTTNNPTQPAGCVVEHGWMKHPDVTGMKLTVSGTGDPAKDGAMSPVVLPNDPKVVDITASSSGAMGFLTSPTLMRGVFDMMGKNDDAFGTFYDFCLAETFQPMGIAQPSMPMPSNHESKFRFIDGGFVENTAIAATIGKIAADFPDETYLGKFIHWDLDKTFGENRVMALFDVKDCRAPSPPPAPEQPKADPVRWTRAPSPPSSPPWYDDASCTDSAPCNTEGGFCTDSSAYGQHNANGIGRPVSKIFAEQFPKQDQWTEYAYYNGPIDPGSSYYWYGRVTTVENKFYNVPAGKELDILIFSLNQPTEDQIFAGGDFLAPLWSTVYGDIARQQALGAEPIIRQFVSDVAPAA